MVDELDMAEMMDIEKLLGRRFAATRSSHRMAQALFLKARGSVLNRADVICDYRLA
jgi:hypothetical protein